MRWLRDHYCEVLGYTGACVDFLLDLVLNLLETKHHAPEQERDDKVEEDDHEADHILGDLDVRATNRDAGSAALGDHHELPVAWACSHQIALAFRQLALIEVELACLLALTLGLKDPIERSLVSIIKLKVVTRRWEEVVVIFRGVGAACCSVAIDFVADGNLTEGLDCPKLSEIAAESEVCIRIICIRQVVSCRLTDRA